MQNTKLKYACLFSGIGAPLQGAYRVYGKENVEHIFSCEFDKFARQSFEANYDIEPEHFHKDVHDMDGTQYRGKVDVIAGGSPCQSFSIAGLRKGTGDERGQLIYQYIRIVDEVKPPVIIYENVKGILSIDGGRTIKEFVQALRDIGYHCHHDVVNTKHYGVPQNRERFFLVGFLNHEHYHRFQFADKVPLTKRIKDILEDDVDEKYYINDEKYLNFITDETRIKKRYVQHDGDVTVCQQARQYANWNGDFVSEPKINVLGMLDVKGADQIRRVYDPSGIAATLTTMQGGNQEPKIVASRGRNIINPSDRTAGVKVEQRLEVNDSGTSNCLTSVQKDNYVIEPKILDLTNDFGECSRREYKDFSPTLRSERYGLAVKNKYRIRKLTPRECLRLQDFPDTFKQVVSNSRLYKQAGNSMSVNVLEMIFNQIEKSKIDEPTNTLF